MRRRYGHRAQARLIQHRGQLGVRVVGALADGLMQADRCGQVLGEPAGLRRAAEAVRDGGRDPGAA